MSDITMCSGVGCDLKHKCYRFTAERSDRQSWFTKVPLKDGNCEMFWGEKSEDIYADFIDILSGKLKAAKDNSCQVIDNEENKSNE